MLTFLPSAVRGCLLTLCFFLNTIGCFAVLFPLAVARLAIPSETWRHGLARVLLWIATSWVAVNRLCARVINRIEWDVAGLEGLEKDQWYLVVSNHQSWTDILVLQTVFFGKIPFLKFFLKKELIWVPFLGIAWWALDFPFMKRYSAEFLKQHPELAGKDIETTKKACEKFRKSPISVMNFVEGTRFTPGKHKSQASPYAHLLRPKAGGTAFVLAAMGDIITAIVNVTIAYPHGKKSFWDFVCGRVDLVRVRVETLPMDQSLAGDYFNDPAFRDKFQEWLNRLWQEKDQTLERLKKDPAPRT